MKNIVLIKVDKEISPDLRCSEQAEKLVKKIKDITDKNSIATVNFSNVNMIISNFGSPFFDNLLTTYNQDLKFLEKNVKIVSTNKLNRQVLFACYKTLKNKLFLDKNYEIPNHKYDFYNIIDNRQDFLIKVKTLDEFRRCMDFFNNLKVKNYYLNSLIQYKTEKEFENMKLIDFKTKKPTDFVLLSASYLSVSGYIFHVDYPVNSDLIKDVPTWNDLPL